MSTKPSSTANRYPFYSPRFWNGMRCGDFVALLQRYRYQVGWQRLPMMFLVGGCTIANSTLAACQRWRYGAQIDRQAIDPPPVFVVGHWRSGTTLLHELLALDSQFTYPTTLECFLPHHFLVSEPLFRPLLRLLLPSKRPMDNMPAGVDLPQEDEFALLAMGAPSPYQRIAFPNLPAKFSDLLNMETVDPATEAAFARDLTTFFRSLMVRRPQRLILKSPTHTGRVGWLAKQFPGSRFIHISRNPVEVFLSTQRLWRRLDEVQGFQVPRYSATELAEMVHRDYQSMYRGYFKGRRDLGPNQLIEIQFEQLIADPATVFQQIYEQLGLGDAGAVVEAIRTSMSQRRNHESARYQLPPDQSAEVMRLWGQYALTFGYDRNTGQPVSQSTLLKTRA